MYGQKVKRFRNKVCPTLLKISLNLLERFTIVEKGSSLGGTWYDNVYPGT